MLYICENTTQGVRTVKDETSPELFSAFHNEFGIPTISFRTTKSSLLQHYPPYFTLDTLS